MLPNQKEAMRQYDAYRLPRLVVIDKNKKAARCRFEKPYLAI